MFNLKKHIFKVYSTGMLIHRLFAWSTFSYRKITEAALHVGFYIKKILIGNSLSNLHSGSQHMP